VPRIEPVVPTTVWASGCCLALGVTDVRPLVVVAAVVTGLAVTGALPTWSGLAHHTALPPLDLFADVRVLLAEAPSYPAFVAGLAAAVAVRTVVLAAVLGALHRPGLARIARFYGLALVPALVAGALGFAGVAAVYSPFLWVGAAVALVTAVALAPGPWQGPPNRLYRPAARTAVVGYLAALLVVSLGSALGSAAARVALVWVSAALTALVGRWLSGPAPEPRPLGAAALVLLLVVVPLPAARQPTPTAATGGTLFLVPGIGGSSGTSSMFQLDPAALGFDCRRTAYFSYAGTGRGAPQRRARCPITSGALYRSEDTRRPLRELAASFRDQLAGLTPPVVVVAHSQGAWIATAGLADTAAVQDDAVGALVLLGAFPRHERGYVLDGTGAGVVGTDALEALTAGLRDLDATSFDPRAPLAREVLGTHGAVDRLMTAGFPAGVRVATVTSAFDLPVMPRDWQLDGAADLCPVYVRHGDLPTSPVVLRQARAFLDGRDQDGCAWWHRWPTQAFAAFGTPSP
jgi:hypothetical protein